MTDLDSAARNKDVEGHKMPSADERLEEAIAQVEGALAALRALRDEGAEEDDVEGHRYA